MALECTSVCVCQWCKQKNHNNLITILRKTKFHRKGRETLSRGAVKKCAWAPLDCESTYTHTYLTRAEKIVRKNARQIFLKYFVFTIAESSFLLILLFSIIFNLNYYFLFDFIVRARKLQQAKQKKKPTTICLFFLGQMRKARTVKHTQNQTQQHKHTHPPLNANPRSYRAAFDRERRANTTKSKQNIFIFHIFT